MYNYICQLFLNEVKKKKKGERWQPAIPTVTPTLRVGNGRERLSIFPLPHTPTPTGGGLACSGPQTRVLCLGMALRGVCVCSVRRGTGYKRALEWGTGVSGCVSQCGCFCVNRVLGPK